MEFRIDRRSGVAAYVQIGQQVKQALRMGLLEVGDRLPTAREVVAATAVNPNTVLKAYRELEREGLVEGRRGLGTFVRRSLASAATAPDSALRADLAAWAARARAAGLDREEIGALFTAVLDEAPAPDLAVVPGGGGGGGGAGTSAAGTSPAEPSDTGPADAGGGPAAEPDRRASNAARRRTA